MSAAFINGHHLRFPGIADERNAAAASRLAVSRKSMVCPVESTAQ
jgi:hypothetical protein